MGAPKQHTLVITKKCENCNTTKVFVTEDFVKRIYRYIDKAIHDAEMKLQEINYILLSSEAYLAYKRRTNNSGRYENTTSYNGVPIILDPLQEQHIRIL